MRTLLVVPILAILAQPLAAQGVTTFCKDGTHTGVVGNAACVGHGGVNVAATQAKAERDAATARRADAKAKAKAEKEAKAAQHKAEVEARAKAHREAVEARHAAKPKP